MSAIDLHDRKSDFPPSVAQAARPLEKPTRRHLDRMAKAVAERRLPASFLEWVDGIQWVLYRLVMREGATKATKPPFTAKSKIPKLAHIDNPDELTTFEHAYKSIGRLKMDGMGYVFPEGYVGVDMDGVRNPATGEIDPDAKEILDKAKVAGTYAEISPSGTGFHIICKGYWPIPPGQGNRKKWLEVYDVNSTRYFTVTGCPYGESREIVDCQELLNFIAQNHFGYTGDCSIKPKREPKETKSKAKHRKEREEASVDSLDFNAPARQKEENRNSGTSSLSPSCAQPLLNGPTAPSIRPSIDSDALIAHLHPDDQKVIARFPPKQRAQFNRLFSGIYDHDHSAADFQLCQMLAWATNGNIEQIDHIFRASGLCQSSDRITKWERLGMTTIDNAIAGLGMKADSTSNVSAPASNGQCDNSPLHDHPIDAYSAPIDQMEDKTPLIGEFFTKKRWRQYDDDHPEPQPEIMMIKNIRDIDYYPDYIDAVRKHSKNVYRFAGNIIKVYNDGSGTIFHRLDRFGLNSLVRECSHTYRVTIKKNPDGGEYELKSLVNPSLNFTQCLFSCPIRVAQTFDLINGVSKAPLLKENGDIVQKYGYDKESGVYVFFNGQLNVPEMPSREDVNKAKAAIDSLLDEFPFETPTDLSVAIALLFTSLVRPNLPHAPMFVIDAPQRGSGKSVLVDVASIIAGGDRCPATEAGWSTDETDKRMAAALLDAQSIINIDNVTKPLGTATLCMMLTQKKIVIRSLGRTKQFSVPCSSTITATGNNIKIVGDLNRRSLKCRLKPTIEHAEQRRFKKDIISHTMKHRPELLTAIFTILRAYIQAGNPDQQLKPFASFGVWSSLVRSAIVWAGWADPNNSTVALDEEDPEREALAQVVSLWAQQFQNRPMTAAQAVLEASRLHPSDPFLVALREVAPAQKHGAIDAKKLGQWIGRNKDRVCGGFRFVKADYDSHNKIILWRVDSIVNAEQPIDTRITSTGSEAAQQADNFSRVSFADSPHTLSPQPPDTPLTPLEPTAPVTQDASHQPTGQGLSTEEKREKKDIDAKIGDVIALLEARRPSRPVDVAMVALLRALQWPGFVVDKQVARECDETCLSDDDVATVHKMVDWLRSKSLLHHTAKHVAVSTKVPMLTNLTDGVPAGMVEIDRTLSDAGEKGCTLEQLFAAAPYVKPIDIISALVYLIAEGASITWRMAADGPRFILPQYVTTSRK